MLGTSFHPHYKMKRNWWFANTGKSWVIETPFSRFVKRARNRSLDRIWPHFSLDDAYTKISGVFWPAPACLFIKEGLFSILVPNSPKVTKKVLVFRKVARSCSQSNIQSNLSLGLGLGLGFSPLVHHTSTIFYFTTTIPCSMFLPYFVFLACIKCNIKK